MYGPEVGTYVRTMPLLLPSHKEHGTGTGLRNQKREETINFEKIRRILNFPHTTHSWSLPGESRREQESERERKEGTKGPK